MRTPVPEATGTTPGAIAADPREAPDAFHLPVGRPGTHKVYRGAAHPSRLVLPFTKAAPAPAA
ncbi:hypothetical protein [Streptomyces sp. NPDC048737]|uniref:hypothetical protein n=1 Tax=unclassified Streptomyces TaxID=2593676 RepID=UPI0034416612